MAQANYLTTIDPEEQILHPPEDFFVWEQQRWQNRGLKEI
jgi:hypothetical protein